MVRSVLLVIFSVIAIGISAQTSNGSTSNSGITYSAQSEVLSEDIKVFPNPASDYFQINNGVNVKRVVVYNMFGKEIKSFFHYTNAQHEISDLKAGLYMVKMLDDRNKIVKSIKLHKNLSGV